MIFTKISHIKTSIAYISMSSALKINRWEYLPQAVTLSQNTQENPGMKDWLALSLIVDLCAISRYQG